MLNSKELLTRCSNFAVDIIEFCRSLEKSFEANILKDQIIRASCSIGANYSEALEAESKRDFIHKILISKKESKEVLHWLYIISKVYPNKKAICSKLHNEANELVLIFSKTIVTTKSKMLNVK